MNKSDQFIINQSLHGYANGHSLLASSITLPIKADRTMLILSDMSGHSMLEGFEKYITGYPLFDINKYIFARTWYAFEMNRPGCVWTHSLLIDFSDLSQIKDVGLLAKLFNRPEKVDTFIDYKIPIKIDTRSIFNKIEKPTIPWDKLQTVLRLIYDFPDQPIYLSTENNEEAEGIVLSIWNQQWPRLRRSFSFSTGSLSIRKLPEGKFDLQIIPSMIEGKVIRDKDSGIIYNFTSEEINGNDLRLTEKYYFAAKSIISIENNFEDMLHKYLWTFGSEFSDGRIVFSKLIDIYASIQELNHAEKNIGDLLNVIAKYFTEKQEASILKNYIFGGDIDDKKWLLPSVKESHILNELCNTSYYSIFDIEQLNIRLRAKKLWENSPSKAKQITIDLFQNHLTPIGLEFIIGVSEVIDTSELIDISSIYKQSVYTFIKYKPELAGSSEIWQATPSEQYELLKTITEVDDIPEKTIEEITLAILKSGSDSIIPEFMNHYDAIAVRTILDWVNESDSISINCISKPWRNVLKTKPHLLLKWMKVSDNKRAIVQALIASLLSPNSDEVLAEGAALWLPLAQCSKKNLSEEILIDTMAFLLAVGYYNPGVDSDKLVAISFEIVHNAVRNDKLKESNWQFFKAIVPELYWWQDWDRCERLRRGLVDRFIKYEWPLESFSKALQNSLTFMKVVEYCLGSKQGRTLLRNFKQQIIEKRIIGTEEQIEILRKVI